MSLQSNLTDLATRVATECKSLRTLLNNNASDLTALTTTAKSNLVAAINELKAAIDAGGSGVAIDDTTPATTTVYSSQKTVDSINAAVAALVASAPGALDTLDELAAALGDDAAFSTTVTTALGNRVRVDTAAQGLTSTQQGNARTNIDVYSTTQIGSVTADFVATFNAGLV